MAQRKISRRELVKAVAAAGAATALRAYGAETPPPRRWDREADVVVIGAGAAGLPAAIAAWEAGPRYAARSEKTSAATPSSGGNLPLGGGTSQQKKSGIEDSPDLVFSDLTDWSVVQPNGFPDYRYNDREIMRAFADYCAPTFEWLLEHGVVFIDKALDNLGGSSRQLRAARNPLAATGPWVQTQARRAASGA